MKILGYKPTVLQVVICIIGLPFIGGAAVMGGAIALPFTLLMLLATIFENPHEIKVALMFNGIAVFAIIGGAVVGFTGYCMWYAVFDYHAFIHDFPILIENILNQNK